MPTIHLTNFIAAPVERVFDLSRSISLHRKSMEKYGEEVLSGADSGLMEPGDRITWKAKHLGKKRILKITISAMDFPSSFTDEMLEGDFKMLQHEHYFRQVDNGTILIDIFHFEAPYGVLGKLFSKFYLTNYLRRLLELRNRAIKEYAEGNKWQLLLQ